MASIKKRRNTYNVVYYYTDGKGKKRQKWESFPTYEEAHKRRAEVEYRQDTGTFVSPSKQTVAEYLDDFVRLYGEKRWGLSVYTSNTSLIRNYILPALGHMPLQDVTPLAADRFIQQLQKTLPVPTASNRHKASICQGHRSSGSISSSVAPLVRR